MTGRMAVVLALVCIVVLATIEVPLPFWADAARMDLLILAGLGGAGALVVGRPAYRFIAGALLLIAATMLQFLYAGILMSEGPSCGSAQSDLSLLVIFLPLIVMQRPIIVIGIVVFVSLFAYGALSRAPVLVRLSIVTAFLIALGGATVFAGQLVAASTSHRCVDF